MEFFNEILTHNHEKIKQKIELVMNKNVPNNNRVETNQNPTAFYMS